MAPAKQSPELVDSVKSPAEAVAYDLRGLAEGTSGAASPLSELETLQLQELLQNLAPGIDIEYPQARNVLQPGYANQRKFREWTLNVGEGSFHSGKGSKRPEPKRRPAAAPAAAPKPDIVSGLRSEQGGPPPSQEILARAAGAGAAAVIGLSFLAASLADLIPLWAGLVTLLLFAWVCVAIWPEKRRPGSITLSSRLDPQAPELWALRVGASFREAVGVGLRTGGLGLLVQPAERSEKGPEAQRSESKDPDNPPASAST
jgi:hypothetical protein